MKLSSWNVSTVLHFIIPTDTERLAVRFATLASFRQLDGQNVFHVREKQVIVRLLETALNVLGMAFVNTVRVNVSPTGRVQIVVKKCV